MFRRLKEWTGSVFGRVCQQEESCPGNGADRKMENRPTELSEGTQAIARKSGLSEVVDRTCGKYWVAKIGR